MSRLLIFILTAVVLSVIIDILNNSKVEGQYCCYTCIPDCSKSCQDSGLRFKACIPYRSCLCQY
uniref:Potassium channel toxin MeuTXKalpha4 n=1 Tax=Mesobuthus eupeus TaxID=34648 RepID=KAXU4_MESEU|nr:RecName: Full=Potassium channel toxin MeuTXKalpha4; AltName: Full=Potassium channel toxin alpha-KTx; AltName: Full=Venom antimicrobial peptide-8; Flags: Precursor [Mesobuthus eupeus]ABR21058.1 venom antimicrobial peptide-8 [Mesobuthus eupeus]